MNYIIWSVYLTKQRKHAMNEPQAVEVSILGQSYTLTCPSGKEGNLRQAAETLDQKMQAIKAGGRVMGLERMAVMAALNMSAELIETQAQLATLETALEQLDKRVSDNLIWPLLQNFGSILKNTSLY